MRIAKVVNIVVFLLVLNSFIFLFTVEKGRADGNHVYVNNSYLYSDGDGSVNHPYRSIQQAIDIVNEGDTIYVFEGTYNETLEIDKGISLIGLDRDNTTIEKRDDSSRYIIEITADHVVLEDFTISDTPDEGRVALIYVSSDYATIQGNNITHSNVWGIYLHSSNDNTIGDNLINDTKEGIHAYYSDNNVFSNNDFGNCSEAAIKLIYSDNNIVYNNTIDNGDYGIYTQYCSNNNISNNTVTDCFFHGIKIHGGSDNTINYNYLKSSGGSGIRLDSSNNRIHGNEFDRNQIGISLAGSNCEITNNSIHNSAMWGIYIDYVSDNIIYSNRFNDNYVNARENGNNQWYHDELYGNYWDDYKEVDGDEDGIGDTPYVKNGVQDQYPKGYFKLPPSQPTDPSPEDNVRL